MSHELAGMGQRLAARLLDWVLVGLGGLILLMLFTPLLLLWMVMAILYEPWMTAVTGQTLGKQALKIKVIRADDGLVPGWGKSIGRWVIPTAASFITAGFGGLLVYLSPVWHNRKQGWHDLAAQTLVIKA